MSNTTKEQRKELKQHMEWMARRYDRHTANEYFLALLDDLEAAEEEVKRLREFITYWSYCTYTGMLRSCPEKQNELREALASCGVEPYRQESESGK